MVREGCCSCVTECPLSQGFKSDKFFCLKPKAYFTNPRKTSNACFLANAKTCEKLGENYVAPCKKGFKRVGSALCIPECPAGTTDMGDKCLRTVKKMETVFTWAAGDDELIA